MSKTRQANVMPKTPKTFLDRLEVDGEVATDDDITNIKTRVFQYDSFEDADSDTNGTEQGAEITTLSASCMFDTLQEDGLWNNRDSLGYNCKIVIPATRFPDGGKYYGVENTVQPSAVGAEAILLERWILYALPTALD